MYKKFKKLSCTRRIEFDAAHRIIGHNGKCKYLHGHRYVVEASFTCEIQRDMVIDFGLIKEKISGWIDNNWDHTTILSRDDEQLGRSIEKYTNQKIFYTNQSPTAENMALFLINSVIPSLFENCDFHCNKLRLYETPNCYAEVEI